MEESSFLSNSSNHKKRKPIFSKNDHSPVTKLNDNFNNTSSYFALPNRNLAPNLNYTSSQVIAQPVQSRINYGPQSAQRVSSAPRINYSQPKISAPGNPHVIYHPRPATPMMVRQQPQNIVYHMQPMGQPIQPMEQCVQPMMQSMQVMQPMMQSMQVMQPMMQSSQSTSYNSCQPMPSTLRRSSHHMKQTQSINIISTDRRRVEAKENGDMNASVKPALVAIERVMKEVGSNVVDKKITYLSKDQSEQISPSTQSRSRTSSGDAQITKLAEINSLLSENYSLLYNQFFNLKKEIKEEEVVEEQTFLKRSMNQIQSIFYSQTNHALTQIDQLYQSKRQPIKRVTKSRADVKIRNVYV